MVEGVDLAPVRPPAGGDENRLDVPEEGPVVVAVVPVDGDVAAVPVVGRGQGDVVGPGAPHLDREADVLTAPVDDPVDLPQHLGRVGEGHGVLHLREAHPPGGDEDVVGVVGELPLREHPRGEPVDRRGDPRGVVHHPAQGAEDPVVHGLVGDDLPPPGDRRGRGVRGQVRVRLHVGDVGPGEPVVLEVVDRGAALREGLDERRQRFRALDGGEHEGRHDGEGDLRHHAEGTEPDPAEVEQRVTGAAVVDRAVGGDRPEPADHPGEAGEAQARAVRAGRHGPGERLRVDVALVGEGEPVGTQEPGDVPQPGAGEERHLRAPVGGGAVDGDDAAEPVEAEQHPVGHGEAGEGVARADDLESPAPPGGVEDGVTHRPGRLRPEDGRGVGGLAARPVGPGGGPGGVSTAHRNVIPSPR